MKRNLMFLSSTDCNHKTNSPWLGHPWRASKQLMSFIVEVFLLLCKQSSLDFTTCADVATPFHLHLVSEMTHGARPVLTPRHFDKNKLRVAAMNTELYPLYSVVAVSIKMAKTNCAFLFSKIFNSSIPQRMVSSR